MEYIWPGTSSVSSFIYFFGWVNRGREGGEKGVERTKWYPSIEGFVYFLYFWVKYILNYMTEERGRGFERVEEEMREVENEGK